jgi:C-terminal processing protease CtpA/Prc
MSFASDRPSRPRIRLFPAAAVVGLALAAAISVTAQLKDSELGRGRTMLKTIKKDLKSRYYDPAFRGIDLDARFLKAEQDLGTATSLGHMFGIIGQTVADLGDSHTRFIPPSRAAEFEYGWRMRPVGDRAYVFAVKPGSDAEAKGLKVGDAVISVNGRTVGRKDVGTFRYIYFSLRPAAQMRLVVQSPGSPPRQIDIQTRIDQGSKRIRDYTQGEDVWDYIRELEDAAEIHRYFWTPDDGVFVWNVPSFIGDVDDFKQMAARFLKYKAVVFDLRGNPGGQENALASLLGFVLDHDVTIAERRGRGKPKKPLVAKTQGEKAFKGKVVVVVDGDSGSSAELFARVIQLEKRGTVIGDRTAGAVMEAKLYSREMGAEFSIFYGLMITESDLIMADGQSLEGIGVVPDELLLPTAQDLAAGRDPVLAKAVSLAGGLILPEEAAKQFPYIWD